MTSAQDTFERLGSVLIGEDVWSTVKARTRVKPVAEAIQGRAQDAP